MDWLHSICRAAFESLASLFGSMLTGSYGPDAEVLEGSRPPLELHDRDT